MHTIKYFLSSIVFLYFSNIILIYPNTAQADPSRLAASLTQESSMRISANLIQCNLPRPAICYEAYQPVCAIVDDANRSNTPQKMTFANDCKACANPSVVGFMQGECEENR